jgi:hypothetical protein
MKKYINLSFAHRFSQSRLFEIVWIVLYLTPRVFINLRGVPYDGNRPTQYFMQFPDVTLVNLHQIPNIFFNFHETAPGLPILEAVFKAVAGNSWQIIAQIFLYSLGIWAGIRVIRLSRYLNLPSEYFLTIICIFLACNPAMIFFDNQFYSTSYVSYMLIIILTLIFEKKTSRSWLLLAVLGTCLVLIRPTFNAYLILPIVVFILFKHVKKVLPISLALIFLVIPTATSQIYKSIEFHSVSFSSLAATSMLREFETSEPAETYNRKGYYPFEIRKGVLAQKTGSNPLLDNAINQNRTINWNYRGYLHDYQLDQSHLLKIVGGRLGDVPKFIGTGFLWSLTNPTCDRVVSRPFQAFTHTYTSIFSRVFYWESGPNVRSPHLYVCNRVSGIQYAYFLLVFFFAISFLHFLFTFKQRVFKRHFLAAFLTVGYDFLLSYANGSPELSKYRMETEIPIILLVFLYFLIQVSRPWAKQAVGNQTTG